MIEIGLKGLLMIESIFKHPALITYLVKILHERYPNKQIGKTVIQKLIYLLTLRSSMDIRYSMYYYGPYSQEVNDGLNLAESIDAVEIKWINDKGYFISTQPSGLEKLEPLLDKTKTECIEAVVDEFGNLMASELSIIATGLYLRDNFSTPDEQLIDAIHDIKRQYSIDYIKEVLEKGGVMTDSQISN
jgi:uncharacterized protein YwgA